MTDIPEKIDYIKWRSFVLDKETKTKRKKIDFTPIIINDNIKPIEPKVKFNSWLKVGKK